MIKTIMVILFLIMFGGIFALMTIDGNAPIKEYCENFRSPYSTVCKKCESMGGVYTGGGLGSDNCSFPEALQDKK